MCSWANTFDLTVGLLLKKRQKVHIYCWFALCLKMAYMHFKNKCHFKEWLWITNGSSALLALTKPQAEVCVLYLLILVFQISLKCSNTVWLETQAVTLNLPFWFVWPVFWKEQTYIMNTGICYVPISCLGLDLEICFQFMAKEINCHQKWYSGLREDKKRPLEIIQ